MANKRITELEEFQDETNLFIIGTEQGDENQESKIYDLSYLNTKITSVSNFVCKDLEEFSPDNNYYMGQYVIYNSVVYEFIIDHESSPWSDTDVKEVKVFDKLNSINNINSTSSEYVYIKFNLDSTISGDDAFILVNNTNRFPIIDNRCHFSISKGEQYIIKFPQIAGYIPVDDLTYTSELDDRFINIFYYREKSTLEINFIVYNEDYDKPLSEHTELSVDEQNPLDGLSVTVGGSTANIANSIAIINNLEVGREYELSLPDGISKGYRKPPIDNLPILGKNMKINIVYKPYKEPGAYLIYTIESENDNLEYKEVKISSLFNIDDENNVIWVGSDEDDITESNSIAVHIYPPNSNATFSFGVNPSKASYFDYIVKIYDLVHSTPRALMSTSNNRDIGSNTYTYAGKYGILAGLSPNDYVDGIYNSYYLRKIVEFFSETPISDTCSLGEKGEMLYKGKILHEFIGSTAQTLCLAKRFDTNPTSNLSGTGKLNYNDIKNLLDHFGYTDPVYTRTGIVWTSNNHIDRDGGYPELRFPCYTPYDGVTSMKYGNGSDSKLVFPFYAPYEYIPRINLNLIF